MTFSPDSLRFFTFIGALLGACSLLLLTRHHILSRFHRRYTCRFEIFWDRKLRPYCPRCRNRLSEWGMHQSFKFELRDGRMQRIPVTFGAFRCVPCETLVRLVDEDGFEVDLDFALERLRTGGTPAVP
ncbi:hypothetical protein SAMN05660860_03064 [Geoalkalibacter ferrihydriticus]|uniref:Uncharacterized protein n=2 Tax=Geoalkalibacter ferrihydriticus TaxID=392333 RepID=A0A0C2HFI1_9BACT|nr:hypothetical protein [Geoalkalibacter ferrihydriticus]KIH75671.1 hypothetical protein GFER_15205 [Geoalkalibacter ferrihydriticus DSM 17813]SDM72870.1 hypothetical protein SAMN05660860_03064 [Geoalkalibacter ferrihydriticus]